MASTLASAPAGTASTDSDTHSDAGSEVLPPCRVAEKYVMPCPCCKRKITLKWMRSGHICRRSFDPAQRAKEQQVNAKIAVLARSQAQLPVQTQTRQQALQHTNMPAHPPAHSPAHLQQSVDYSMLKFR